MSTSAVYYSDPLSTTDIYTLSLHDALPISGGAHARQHSHPRPEHYKNEPASAYRAAPARAWHGLSVLCSYAPPHGGRQCRIRAGGVGDRKSTRLNSSHVAISYAVFCLKKTRL